MLEKLIPDDAKESPEISGGSALVVIIDGPIEYDMKNRIFLVLANGKSITLPPLNTLRTYLMFKKDLELSAKKAARKKKGDMDYRTEQMTKSLGLILKDMGVEALSQLLTCKHLAFLINTEGGNENTVHSLEMLSNLVKENGGRVESYVGNMAISGGACLVESADKTFALPTSSFLWHIGRNDQSEIEKQLTENELQEFQPLLDEQALKDVRRIEDFLLSRVVEDQISTVKERLAAMLSDPTNIDHSAVFTGAEMETMGLANTVSSTDTLRATLRSNMPFIDQLKNQTGAQIERFFDNCRIEELIHRDYGYWICISHDQRDIWSRGEEIPEEVYSEIIADISEQIMFRKLLKKEG